MSADSQSDATTPISEGGAPGASDATTASVSSADAELADGALHPALMPKADAGSAIAEACRVEEPALDCIRQLYTPLSSAQLPFDAKALPAALGQNDFAVAAEWHLTAHHVLESRSAFPYRCFYESYQYAESEPFSGPGCGTVLMAGGHARATQCLAAAIPMARCADQVPFSQAFDIALVRGARRDAVFPLAPEAPQVGETVYVVSTPSFAWLDADQRSLLKGPLVSSGRVLAVEGRGAIIDAATSFGSSGSPVLNSKGQVYGLIYTSIGDQRRQGTSTPTWAHDADAVLVLIDAKTRDLVDRQL